MVVFGLFGLGIAEIIVCCACPVLCAAGGALGTYLVLRANRKD